MSKTFRKEAAWVRIKKAMLLCLLVGLLVACGGEVLPVPTTPLPVISRSPTAPPTIPALTPIPILQPATPTPTPTSTFRSVWRIFFQGSPCPAYATCDVLKDEPSRFFFVNSDGSGLEESPDFSSTPGPGVIGFSADGSHVAYWDGPVLVLARSDGSSPVRLPVHGGGYAVYVDFLGNDCLALYKHVLSPKVTTERICVGDSEPQVLDTVEFPGDAGYRFYRISPQGDKLLAYDLGGHLRGDVRIYVKALGSDEPPHLLFPPSPSSESCTLEELRYSSLVSIHWSSDEMIEFLWCCDRDCFFQQVDWQGREIVTRLMVQGVGEGDWSPDGREFAFGNYVPPPGYVVTGEDAGLYVLDLDTGEKRKIVSEIYVERIRTVGWVEDRK